MAVITISREPGALGEEVAARVAGHLGFSLIDKAGLAKLRGDLDLDQARPGTLETASAGDDGREAAAQDPAASLSDLIARLAEEQDMVIIGRGAQGLFHDCPGTLHVKLIAPRKFRVLQVQTHERLSEREARRRIRSLELERARYLRSLYGMNWEDPGLYDLTLRMDRLSIEQALKLIVTAFNEMGLGQVPRSLIVRDLLPEMSGKRNGGRFVNAAEEEFAGFLEFYHIPYKYEPRTFPLEADAEGRIVEAFTPDFYLPEQDLYIELTTMKQSLVTRKNRKVRKLRRLYPEIHIRVFYQRDFQNLLAKYGLLAAPEPSKIISRLSDGC